MGLAFFLYSTSINETKTKFGEISVQLDVKGGEVNVMNIKREVLSDPQ